MINLSLPSSRFSRNVTYSAALLTALAITFGLYVRCELAVDRANAARINSLLLGDQTRQTSNDLTRMARAYVVTGDTIFRKYYQEILDIRDGRSPRPKDYSGTYWDLFPSLPTSRYGDVGATTSLLMLIRQAGFHPQEFERLATAKEMSDSLARTELAAIRLADSAATAGSQARELALKVLYGEDYHDKKATIMRHIDEFVLAVDRRTHAAVNRAKTIAAAIRLLFIGLGAALSVMLWRTYAALRATMGGPVSAVARQISTLGSEDFAASDVTRPSEDSVLGWLSNAHRRLTEVNQQRALSEDRMRAVVESALDCIISITADGHIIEFNPAAEHTFGYTKDEAIGKVAADLIIPERLRAQHRAGIERYLTTGEVSMLGRRIEMPALRADGTEFPIELAVIPLGTPESRIFTGFLRDISDRKHHEEKLTEQASLLDRARDAIIVRDLDHRVKYWNKSAERLYGWSADEATGRSVAALLFKEPTTFRNASREVITKGEWVGELEQLAKDGRRLTIEGRWTLVRDAAGEPRSIMAIDTDITERKKLEQQFLRSQRMESIGTLAGGIAHDLNNVLAPIMMSVDLLKQSVPADEDRELLDAIAASSRRAAEMVSQVLLFARGMDGRRVPIRVKHLVGDIAKIISDTFPKQIVVRTLVKPDLWTILGDPTQLHQVLLNLAVNSRDAMPDGGQISITAHNLRLEESELAPVDGVERGRYVVIEFEDTGKGISPDDIGRIFDPFFTTKQFGKGTGLGLSTSLGIVRSHGGLLRVYSEPGKGTRFRIHLPAQTDADSSETECPVVELARGNGETVLIVDDEASIRQITSQTLEAFGYKAMTAQDGAAGIAIYAEHQHSIAVVLTDMMMPLVDGPAMIQVLLRINPRVRIIAASGMAENRGLATDATKAVKHFLAKPYSAETLLSTLQRVLAER